MTGDRLHAECLPAIQQHVLRRCGPLADERGFYLAGGTALALQLGHRRSIDLDWFRIEAIPDPVALARDLQLKVRSVSGDTLHAESDGVEQSFFAYRYPLVAGLVPGSPFGCSLASIDDIAAMKLAAIGQRGARKDYFDIVAIGRAGLGLERMLQAYRRKFEIDEIGHVLTALTWFDDADQDPDAVLDSSDTWDSVRATLRGWVKDFAGS